MPEANLVPVADHHRVPLHRQPARKGEGSATGPAGGFGQGERGGHLEHPESNGSPRQRRWSRVCPLQGSSGIFSGTVIGPGVNKSKCSVQLSPSPSGP